MNERKKSTVSIVKCKDYSDLIIREKIKATFQNLGGIDSFIKSGDKVLLKPNMFRTDIKGTTNPAIIRCLAEILNEKRAEIYLTDSPMTDSLEKVGNHTGITEICEQMEISMIPVRLVEKIDVKSPLCQNSFYLPSILKDMDLVINLPKIKSHPLTVFSGSVKNLFGLCPGLTKSQFHLKYKHKNEFCQMLIDLYSIVKPGLTIMDAVYGVDSTLKSKKVGYILASRDALGLDSIACRMIGIPIEEVLTFRYGKEKNLGRINKNEIDLKGENISFPITDNFQYEVNHKELISTFSASIFDSFFLKNSFSRPSITDKCIVCGQCRNICPKDAIELDAKKAQINYNRCIRCYCCQEICPNDAIEMKKVSIPFHKTVSIIQGFIVKIRSFESKKKIKNDLSPGEN